MSDREEPHACRDCEVCGCGCTEACDWECSCYEGEESANE